MARRRFLVTYDIVDDKRRSRAARTLENHGDRLQYSVFRCDLNPREVAQLKALLHDVIHHREDQVLFVDLGTVVDEDEDRIESVGRPYQPNTRVRIV
jgi:CRISPR-associated protein Cas2